MLPSLKPTNSQLSIVDGLAEKFEFSSHLFGYYDPLTQTKRLEISFKYIIILCTHYRKRSIILKMLIKSDLYWLHQKVMMIIYQKYHTNVNLIMILFKGVMKVLKIPILEVMTVLKIYQWI